jgi:hypothetical protein
LRYSLPANLVIAQTWSSNACLTFHSFHTLPTNAGDGFNVGFPGFQPEEYRLFRSSLYPQALYSLRAYVQA